MTVQNIKEENKPANYPGVRADISSDYASYLRAFFIDNIAAIFGAFDSGSWSVQSKICLANKAPTDLSPIQSIPHFDTSNVNQIAAVHYLCDAPFQGTSFYQHRTSGFESCCPPNALKSIKMEIANGGGASYPKLKSGQSHLKAM